MNVLWLVLATTLVLVATLAPAPDIALAAAETGLVQWVPFPADFARNLALFLPLGAALSTRRLAYALAAAAALSASVELVQISLPGRISSPWDVVANVAGTWAGHALARVIRTRGLADPRLWRAAYVTWAVAAVVALVAAPLLFRPALPPPPWYAHWTPDLGHLVTYDGHLVSARFAGVPLAAGPLPPRQTIAWLADGARLELRGVAGTKPHALSALFMVTDDESDDLLLLGLAGDDVVYRVATLGMRLGFEYPLLGVHAAFAGVAPGQSFALSVWRAGPHVCLDLDARVRCDLGPRIEDGWQHWLSARPLAAPLRAALDLGWLVALFLPLGAGLRARAGPVAATASALAAFALAPWLGPLSPLGARSIAAVALALAAGVLVARVYRALRRTPSPRR